MSEETSHTDIVAELRSGFARTDERLLTLEREVHEVRSSAATMDERQRQLVQEISEAKGGLAVARWLWAATVGVLAVAVALWNRATG